MIERLHAVVPPAVRVVLLADRGFGDQKLYALLGALGWDYVIRFRECILVEDERGVRQPASGWVGAGRAKKIPNARVTDERTAVPAVVVVHAKAMKEPPCVRVVVASMERLDGKPIGHCPGASDEIRSWNTAKHFGGRWFIACSAPRPRRRPS